MTIYTQINYIYKIFFFFKKAHISVMLEIKDNRVGSHVVEARTAYLSAYLQDAISHLNRRLKDNLYTFCDSVKNRKAEYFLLDVAGSSLNRPYFRRGKSLFNWSERFDTGA